MSSPQNLEVVVAVPVYKPELSADEAVSAHHLKTYLGGFDVVLFAPSELSVPLPGYPVERFEASYFDSVDAYSRLLLSEGFYRRFERYRYLLIYQLDCLVFSDTLSSFCAQGFDYLGAPWLRSTEAPERGFSRVGNGGLSLRRVAAFLRVLTRFGGWGESLRRLGRRMPDLAELGFAAGLAKRLQVTKEARVGAARYAANYSLNEDHFWADRAQVFDPSFRVAPVSAGLRFAFERAPEVCYEANHRQLPFGCHAWAKYDRSFWEPHLLPEEPPCAARP